MRYFLLCLCLGLAAPAWANSLTETVCPEAPASVARMDGSQKLCRSFLMALEKVPSAATVEALALMTPENLAAMGALTSVWVGSQGVPGVGQAVDAALLTLGIVLMAVQAADLSNALWEYAMRSLGAREQADLKAAAGHLAHAIALVGINVVAFILTKKVAGQVKRLPPGEPPPRLATATQAPAAAAAEHVALPSLAHMATEGGAGARSLPSTSTGRSFPKRYLLARVEEWRKPKLTEDGRILPYEGTRTPPESIVNLGRNRAGKAVTNGKHTVRFDQDGFPKFETRFETILDGNHVGSGNRIAHFKAANQKLMEAIQHDPSLAQELGLSPETVSRLPSLSKAPEGYTWHHHQDVGRMQLVQGDTHRLSIPHTGGMAIWGGGQ